MENVEQIWQQYHTNLHGFIQSRVGDESTADDILQEVFLRIHSNIDTLKEDGKIQSWIYQIARNAIIDHYRARKKMEELPSSLSAAEPDLLETARHDIEECVLPMIDSLPDHYREALMLSEIEGLTQKEVAERQGLSVSGAKSRIQRGRLLVKDMLLDCCRFEFDRHGKIVDYDRREPGCDCDDS